METKRIKSVTGGANPSGPYSLGVIAEGKFLFVAGQGPWDEASKSYVRGTIAEQTQRTLESVRRIVEAAGAEMKDVVQCRVFLQPLNEQTFQEMNAVYEQYWAEDAAPARTTVGCTLLGIDVEIDCVVRLPEKD